MTERGCLTLALALAIGTAPTLASAANETYHYEIAWGQVPLVELVLHRQESGSSYNFVGTGQLVGPFAAVYSWRGRAITEGRLEAGRHAPQEHRWDGSFRGSTRTAKVSWNGDGPPLASVEPAPSPEEYTPVPPTTLNDVVDPLTAIVRLLSLVDQEKRCGGEEQVYDGRRRYDLSTEPLGVSSVEADRSWTYAGETLACRIDYERIGGFRKEWRDGEGPPTSTIAIVHLAPIGVDGGWRPVRLETETRLGTVTGRLRR